MQDDPRNITLPSIREWLPEEPAPFTRPRTETRRSTTAITPIPPLSLPAPRFSPLIEVNRRHLQTRRSTSPFRQRASPSSRSLPTEGAPQPPSQSGNRRRSYTYSSQPSRWDDTHHVATRSWDGGNTSDATVVDPQPIFTRPASSSSNHVLRLHRDGSIESIPFTNSLPGPKHPYHTAATSGRFAGRDPVWRIPMVDHPERSAPRSIGRSQLGSETPPAHSVSPAGGGREHQAVILFPADSSSSSRGGHERTYSVGDSEHHHDERSSGSDANRRHVCPICSRRFNRPSSLRIHINTHTGETPFKCPWPDCGREFNVNSNMRRHLRNHTSPGTSRRAGERGAQRQRRRRAADANPAAGPTYQRGGPTPEGPRSRRSSGPSDVTNLLAPPISTLSLRDGSSTSSGASDVEDDYEMCPPDDAEEDQLSDDELQHSANLASNQRIPGPEPGAVHPSSSPPSSVSSPTLSTSSSLSVSTSFSRRSSSMSPPPPFTAPQRGHTVAHARLETRI